MYVVVGRHLHTAYAVLQKYLHQEWSLVQRVTPGIGPAFQPLEDELHGVLLHALFRGPRPRSPVERSPFCQSIKLGLLSLTLLRPPAPTVRHPVSTQDTSLHRSTGRRSLGRGIMPY